MIITCFLAYSYGSILWRLLRKRWVSVDRVMLGNELELAYDGRTFLEDGVFKFAPPVYVQRYMVVREKLIQFGPFKKVVDLGCSELGFFSYLKNLEGVEELLFIDQDEQLLNRRSEVLKPLLIDYLKPRETPLLVKLLQGNAAAPDINYTGTGAIVAIELIEHMFPPDLNELPYTLFGIIQPQVVIITTPNYDFNVLFKLTGFRHLDHKFEWTRQQFKDWVDNIELRFPEYCAKLYGIGVGPEGSSQYGTCSQMVVFHRKQPPSVSQSTALKENLYQVISEIEYPFEPKVEIPLEDLVKYEAEKFIQYAVNYEEYQTQDEIEIPLSRIMRMVTRHTDSQQFLETVLKKSGWRMEEKKSGEKYVVLPLSGIPYSSSSSDNAEPDDEESHFSYSRNLDLPDSVEETWSDHENLTEPVSCWTAETGVTWCQNSVGSSHVDDGSKSLGECCNQANGCDQLECKSLLEPLDINLSDKYESSCSSCKEIKEPCNLGEPSRQGCTDARKSLNPSQTIDLETALIKCNLVDKENLISTDNDSKLNVSFPDREFVSLSERVVSQSSSVPDPCKSGEIVDFQQKMDNESLDKFDESLLTSHSLSKKESFPVKRSLDLPLDSVKVNLNGNFEVDSSLSQNHLEAKSCYPPEIGESNGCKCTSRLFKGLTLDVNSSNSCCIKSVRKAGVCQSTADVNVGAGFDCSEKLDVGKNQTGINRCLSLQYIKEKEGSSKTNRFSLCCEKENINICDIFKDGLKAKSCGHSFDEVVDLVRVDTTANFDDSFSQSKAADSGYPNTSERDMDMDLTPEQVEEIVSENESSLDEREDEEDRGLGGVAPMQFLDHVENGDVANNNRDDEGNNLDQVEVGQPLHFNGIIQQEGNEPPLNEPPPRLHLDSDSDNEDKFLSCCSTSELSVRCQPVRTCLKWVETSTPCHSRTDDSWRLHNDSSLYCISSSSTSLVVHPSSESSTLFNSIEDRFPSWLLSIETDALGDVSYDLAQSLETLSHLSVTDDEHTEVIVPGDTLGGGEPHSPPDL